LLVVGVLWGLGALYNIAISFVLFGPQDSFYLNLGTLKVYSLVMQDASLRVFLQALSLFQIVTAFELQKSASWSYHASLVISGLVLGIYADFFVLYYTAPVHIGLRTPLLYASLGLGIAWAALIWGYVRRPHVKEYVTRWL